MDILVKLKSGGYANIEIQKIGYAFQGERCACYSSDLQKLLQQQQEQIENLKNLINEK